MMRPFYKCSPFNFVPLTRTPWAGFQISHLKKQAFPQHAKKIPERIGESWEVSTDSQFPSVLQMESLENFLLTDLVAQHGQQVLGKNNYQEFGAHVPLLLKWLEAKDNLSVQLHPNNENPLLKSNECGKPEAWLVLNAEPGSYVYLGFQENLTQEQVVQSLLSDKLEDCLYKYYPKKFDYISVPPGCVHAVGPGVLLAEPQYVLPNKAGKTWRISDWGRRYDENGQLSALGKPRELHAKESLSAIDWSLPRGQNLLKMLVRNLSEEKRFVGDQWNPFACQLMENHGAIVQNESYEQLVPESFSLFSIWKGAARFFSVGSADSFEMRVQAGESGMVCASSAKVQVHLEPGSELAFFGLK